MNPDPNVSAMRRPLPQTGGVCRQAGCLQPAPIPPDGTPDGDRGWCADCLAGIRAVRDALNHPRRVARFRSMGQATRNRTARRRQ